MAEVTGLKEFIARVERLYQNSSNLQAPLKNSADYMLGSLDRNFAAEGRPPWKQLAESTLARKSGGMLDETGKMRGSNVVSFSSDGWQIDNTDPKSVFHLKGTEDMAARNWMLFQPEDITAVGGNFFAHITQ